MHCCFDHVNARVAEKEARIQQHWRTFQIFISFGIFEGIPDLLGIARPANFR